MTNLKYRRAYGFRSKSALTLNNRRRVGRHCVSKVKAK